MNRLAIITVLVILVAGLIGWRVASYHTNSPKPNNNNNAQAIFNKSKYSLTDPSSIWVIVNKKRPLSPVNYKPEDLVLAGVPAHISGSETMKVRKPVATALRSMIAAAKNRGIDLMLASGYRSYAYQAIIYSDFVQSKGKAITDRTSARAGYSEHQTGLSVDLESTSRTCELQQCFANTMEGKWLEANAWSFGFLQRYPMGKTSLTGYDSEPWHYRYVGQELATRMHNLKVTTLEEFFGIQGGSY